MAEGGNDDGNGMLSAEDLGRLRKARRLMELFHGRFTISDSCTLLRHHGWNLGQTLTFTLDALPGELKDVLGENDWQVVGNVREDEVLRDLARRNEVGSEIRQFGCAEDDNMWWRRVPVRKPVSVCKMCRRKKFAISRDSEWGWAYFKCQCGHEFRDYGMMDISVLVVIDGKSKSMCRKCKGLCEPISILPPLRGRNYWQRDREEQGWRGRRGGRGGRATGHCTAANCHNRRPPILSVPTIPICVHPRSLNRNVHVPSSDHISTGSTVKTFLTQDDLMDPYHIYEPSMVDIDEVRGDEVDYDNSTTVLPQENLEEPNDTDEASRAEARNNDDDNDVN